MLLEGRGLVAERLAAQKCLVKSYEQPCSGGGGSGGCNEPVLAGGCLSLINTENVVLLDSTLKQCTLEGYAC